MRYRLNEEERAAYMEARMEDLSMGVWGMLSKVYPELNVQTIGAQVCILGALRSILGHESAIYTLRDYSHGLVMVEVSPESRAGLEFLEKEVFCFTKSKLDLEGPRWFGGKLRSKPKSKYAEGAEEKE